MACLDEGVLASSVRHIYGERETDTKYTDTIAVKRVFDKKRLFL